MVKLQKIDAEMVKKIKILLGVVFLVFGAAMLQYYNVIRLYIKVWKIPFKREFALTKAACPDTLEASPLAQGFS